MTKEVLMTFRIEPELREAFAAAATQQHRPASQVLREFMRSYVLDSQNGDFKPANDTISAAELRRRDAAERFARASAALEGFKPSAEALAQTQRHVRGEIPMCELVRVERDDERVESRYGVETGAARAA